MVPRPKTCNRLLCIYLIYPSSDRVDKPPDFMISKDSLALSLKPGLLTAPSFPHLLLLKRDLMMQTAVEKWPSHKERMLLLHVAFAFSLTQTMSMPTASEKVYRISTSQKVKHIFYHMTFFFLNSLCILEQSEVTGIRKVFSERGVISAFIQSTEGPGPVSGTRVFL